MLATVVDPDSCGHALGVRFVAAKDVRDHFSCFSCFLGGGLGLGLVLGVGDIGVQGRG